MRRKLPSARKLMAPAIAVCFSVALTGVIANPAQAASCTLTIGPNINDHYQVTIFCGGIGELPTFGLYGEDTFSDEFRGGPYFSGAIVPRSVLNEDDSFFNGTEDDIFAITSTGARTQTINREF